VGYTCLLIGLLDIATVVLRPLRQSRALEWAQYLPGTLDDVALAATLVGGILLVMLAHGLRRRKKRAWRTVVALLTASIIFHLIRGHAGLTVVISTVFLGVLLARQSQFYAAGDPRTRWRAVINFVALAGASLGLGMLLTGSRPRAVVGHPALAARFQDVLYGLVGIPGPLRYRSDHLADLIYFCLLFLGMLTALSTAYLVLRSTKPTARLAAEEEHRLRELLGQHGARDSLGYFALRRDKATVFSPTGKSAIAYRVVSGVMLAGGDPIGDEEAWPGAIAQFMQTAARHAWIPAVMGCSERGGEVWTREADLSALELGDEAVVDVPQFSLAGRAMRNVRQMVKRIERHGYTCQVRRVGDLTSEEIAHIVHVAAAWRAGATERGFSMALGRLGDPADADCIVVTAHQTREDARDSEAQLRAVLHFVPWGPDGLSLELMRRDRAADPGLNELLIVAALQAAPQLGVTRISLNFAMFRAALARGERIGAGPVLQLWRRLLLFASRWFQIESLYKFNAKFQPTWHPRFLIYPTVRDLPRIAVAALEAEAFIVMPDLIGHLRRWPRTSPAAAPEPGTHQSAA
jgi:lysyl-tRNA synthetase class 2